MTLTRWSIGVELTTTVRAGMGALRYPAGAPAHLLINAGHSANGTQRSTVSVIGSNQVTGSATSGHFCGHPGSYTVHFAVQFDHPFRVWSVWNGSRVTHHGRAAAGVHVGVSVGFGTPDVPTTVLARVGISFVSVGNALANLRAEIPGWSFDTVRSAAADAWNAALNRIQVSGGTAAEREIFYTALYHSLLFPSVFSDTNGQYVGMDGAVHADSGHPQYTNVSGWDVYRSQIPLLALLFPQRTSDIVRSLLRDATQSGGWLPKWAIAGSTTNTMNGDSADAIIAGAYAFGARDFDAGAALSQMIRGATVPGTGPGGYLERPGLAQYLDHGYVAYSYGPRDLESSAATTLEYATDDFAIARLAAALDRWSVWSTFMRRAQNWQRLFNPATGFVQPRMADGSFGAHFVPESERGFREGDAWQYAWMVPQNLAALVRAMGGGPAVADRLRTFFTMLRGGRSSPWYQGSNELDLEAPWEFDFAGQPWGTQEVVRRIVTRLYTDGPSGLPGNDDLGGDVVVVRVGGDRAVPGDPRRARPGGREPAVHRRRRRRPRRRLGDHRGAGRRGRRPVRHEPHGRRRGPLIAVASAERPDRGQDDRVRARHRTGHVVGNGRRAAVVHRRSGPGHRVHGTERRRHGTPRRNPVARGRRAERRGHGPRRDVVRDRSRRRARGAEHRDAVAGRRRRAADHAAGAGRGIGARGDHRAPRARHCAGRPSGDHPAHRRPRVDFMNA